MNSNVILLTTHLAAFLAGTNEPYTESAVVDSIASTTNYTAKSAPVLPSFSLLDANGNEIDLRRFANKKIFINLWASWCLPCRAEMPYIDKLYQQADKNKSAFLLISLDNNFDKAKKFVLRKKFTFPIYAPLEALPELFKVQSIPTTFIFDERGELVQQIEGAANFNTPSYHKYFNEAE